MDGIDADYSACIERDATLERAAGLVAALATAVDRYATLHNLAEEHVTRSVHTELEQLLDRSEPA